MAHRESHGQELLSPAPSAKIASSLGDTYEYAAIWTGQSNSLPWGLPEDAYDYSLELTPQPAGLDLVSILLPPNPNRQVGMDELLLVDSTVILSVWDKSSQLRLGTITAPLRGYADIVQSLNGLLKVEWRSLPDATPTSAVTFDSGTDTVSWPGHNLAAQTQVAFTTDDTLPAELTPNVNYFVANPNVGAGTFQLSLVAGGPVIDLSDNGLGNHVGYSSIVIEGYLLRENGKWYSYENCRVLTPFLPLRRDIRPPIPNDPLGQWTAPHHSPYPVPNGPVASDGQSLILAGIAHGQAPASTVPPAVTVFDDLALYLPMTRREGATGFGISEIADSTFANVGDPTGHPITNVDDMSVTDAIVFTFENAISAGADFTNAYLLIDWEDSGGAAKRSWARVASNDTTTFTVLDSAWLGDMEPDAPFKNPATFDDATNRVSVASHDFNEGDRVVFTGGTLPAGLVPARVYYVRNPSAGVDFQISESMDHPTIDFFDSGSPTITCTRAWVYTCWIPHWKDNPFMWVPGPEFAYPNEDSQPRNTFVHWRARGQIFYAWNNQRTGNAAPNTQPFDGVSDSRFGAMLPFCWRTGVSIGRPLLMVPIGMGSTPLAPAHVTNNASGVFTGTVGWWNHERLGYAVLLEDSESYMAKRLKRLITFMAHEALNAEANTKKLRYLAAVHIQGEADGYTEGGREFYTALVNDYRQWLRDLVDEGGWNPFQGEARMPFSQPLISYDQYEGPSGLLWNDREGEINNAILQNHTQEEFSGYVLVDDLPMENLGHYSGGGMVVLGARLAVVTLDNLEHAFSYGSAALTSPKVNEKLLRIANNALLYVGQGVNTITSLEDGTAEANLVKAMLPQATQDLLEMRPWAFAIRREAAAQIKHNHPEWRYCYVVPGRSMAVLEIIPPTTEEGELPAENRFLPVTLAQSSFSAHVVHRDRYLMGRRPAPFVTEGSVSGHELLFTNVEEVPADLSIPMQNPSNAIRPERLPNRPTIKYIDKQVDPDRYSSVFTSALTWYLASMLAPALIKGPAGEAAAARHLAKASGFVRTAAGREGMMHEVQPFHEPDWIRARR